VHSLPGLLDSVREYVDTMCVLCTGSDDGTWEYLREKEFEWHPQLRPYRLNVPFDAEHFNFGYARTIAMHLNPCGYVLMLDADERMDPTDLQELKEAYLPRIQEKKWMTVALERRHWYDGPKQRKKENAAARPDWQLRLIRNDGSIWYRRPVHEVALFGPRGVWNPDTMAVPLTIHHHHDWFKAMGSEKVDRVHTYQELSRVDSEWARTYSEDMIPADEPRRHEIRGLYKELMGREPRAKEVRTWAISDLSIDEIRAEMQESEEAKTYADSRRTS